MICHIADDDGVLCDIDDLCLVAKHACLSLQLMLGPEAFRDVPDVHHDELVVPVIDKGGRDLHIDEGAVLPSVLAQPGDDLGILQDAPDVLQDLLLLHGRDIEQCEPVISSSRKPVILRKLAFASRIFSVRGLKRKTPSEECFTRRRYRASLSSSRARTS
jgi:hypothetical protein